MTIEVEDSPNCRGTDQFVYRELGPARSVRAIRIEERGEQAVYEVTGVARGGGWVPARSVKVADSGAGFAFLIYGGEWGIRLKAAKSAAAWDLSDGKQWGEPFKLYGSEEDILYADS